jgi:putative pyoverdin transport system ATP-binding/permease protein
MMAMVILTGIIGGAGNAVLIAIMNTVLSGEASRTRLMLWGFIGLCGLTLVTRFISQVMIVRLTMGVTLDLRLELARKMLGAPLRMLEEVGPHRLLASLTDDIPAITNALVNVPVLCINIAIMAGTMAYLGWLYWPGLIAWIIFMALGITSYKLMINRAVRYFRLAREQGDWLYKHFRALTDGTKELKLHRKRREEFLTKSLQTTAASLQHYNIAGNTIAIGANTWGGTLFFIFIGLLLFAFPSAVNLDGAILTGYTLAILYMMSPLQVILNVFPVFSQAEVAIAKIESLGLSLSKEPSEIRPSEISKVAARCDVLEMVGVTHEYHRELENRNFILGPVDMRLQRGELVFLIGGNGCGKTTLAKLLTGLYIPSSGEIRVNGELIDNDNRDDYRQYFSVVFSDFYLFDTLLGLGSAGLDEQAREYLVRLQLNQKVEVKDGRLSTTELSQGQRKRLALLTVYLEDRPIYVFDEWAADQDPLFKEVFYHCLLPDLRSRGKTIVVITHDDRYFQIADRIIKLDAGRIEYDSRLSSSMNAPLASPAI